MRRVGLPPLLAVDLRRISLAEGLRAGFAIAGIVALGQVVHRPALMEAALAAMLTCLCDAGGPVRRRLPALLAFGAIGTVFTALSGQLGGVPAWLLVPAAALVVCATSLARIYGQSAMQVGNLLTVVLALALRLPEPSPARAVVLAGFFLAGNLWALLLTMVIWQLHPYRLARQAVGHLYHALAVLAGDLLRLAQGGAAGAEWELHARQHRRLVREAIEQARDAVLATVRMRGPVTGHAAQSWVRLEAADQTFAALIALAELLETSPGAALAGRAARMLRLLRPVLLLLERAVVADTRARRPGLERAVAAIRSVGRADSDDALSGIAASLADRLRVAVTLSGAEAELPARSPSAPRRWWAILRANLHVDSETLRHALRAGLLAGLGFAVTRIWPGPYVHWFTITLVLTLQPYFALTFTRAVERVGGTVLGGLLAAAIAALALTPVAMAAALFPLAVLALALRPVSYALFMAGLTPVVVLLSELGRPGSSELGIALARAGFTVAGGGLALLSAWVLWPSWEPARVRGQVRAAVAAHARWAAAEIAALLGQGEAAAADRARRAAGLASNALEASLQRALLEPARGRTVQLEAALTIDAALRRVAGRLAALHLAGRPAAAHDRAAWEAWAAFFAAPVAGGQRPALPAGDPDAEALARMATQFDLVAGAAERLV